jgi:hypothetical protein
MEPVDRTSVRRDDPLFFINAVTKLPPFASIIGQPGETNHVALAQSP